MINESLFEFDEKKRGIENKMLCGVDEAGRGPLAGPVVAAAVILNPKSRINNLNDSKKLTEHQREEVFDDIIKSAVAYKIIFVDNDTIDKINILNATLLAMKQAVTSLPINPEIVLIDGNIIPKEINNSEAVIKGDAFSASIAAASILAKVSRDRYMEKISDKYPPFNFKKHKGYATKEHYDEINEYGITVLHRKSFLTKSNRYFDATNIKIYVGE